MITQERLKELLHYDPETGAFAWRVDRRCGQYRSRVLVKAGDEAGYRGKSGAGKSDYIFIRVDGRLYGAHSLAWLYVKGEWPPMLDHRDLDGTNNRFGNIRLSDKSSNAANTARPKNNTSGFKGVWFDKQRGKWAFEVRCRGRRYRGRRETRESAAAAYAAKAIETHGEFARAA